MDATRKNRWLPWLLGVLLVLSLGIAALFTYRAIRMLPRLHSSEEIRPWMTLPYIAHSHHVPVENLYQALGLPFQPHDRRPLYRIARLLGEPEQTVAARLQQAILEFRQSGLPTPTDIEPFRSPP